MDELAKVIAEALYGSVAAELIASERKTPDVFARAEQQSLKAANAVRTYLESPEVVERALVARYHAAGSVWPEAVSEGMQRVERMIMEKTLAALQAAGGQQDG